ncbi:MAG TPA: hypothetical protein VGG04_12350 [Candidatus Sulfotelmatobacter sp.]|jgi:hypothetical protein
MSPETRKNIQLALLAAMAIAGIRVGVILYHRHEDKLAVEQQKKARDLGYSNPDYYVSPKKLHPYDLKSAKELTKQPVWVREGYHSTYFPYDSKVKRVDFGHEPGLLGPIEKLNIIDVITAVPPGAGERRQMMAVFQKDEKDYAVSIGIEGENNEYEIYSDDLFFIEDPHELYKHWSTEIWQAVDHHEVKPGMNDLQVDFAVGMGIPDSGGSADDRTVKYSNGGKPLVVVFRNGKVAEVSPGTSS